MKISNTTQQLAQEEIKKQDIKKAKHPAQKAEAAQVSKNDKNMDISEVKNNPLTQNIKNINSDIGKLQVAQKSLSAIESDAMKMAKLSEDYRESFDKAEQSEIKKEMSILKKNIESVLKKAIFEGNNVFSKNIKNNKEQVIFEATSLNTRLLDTDAQRFYDVLKEQQTQIKDAIHTLQEEAQESASKLTSKKTDSKDMQSADGSFLKKFGSLFRVSHDTDKLSQQRVQELLA